MFLFQKYSHAILPNIYASNCDFKNADKRANLSSFYYNVKR